jgi:predicted DNA-binding transcriptional regulator AlpA
MLQSGADSGFEMTNRIRLVNVAELLGVTKQRTHQIVDEPGFPDPVTEDGGARIWRRREVEAWARTRPKAKPWR